MRGWQVECLVTVRVLGDDSMMYQLCGTALAGLQAASMGVPWLPVLRRGAEELEVLDLDEALLGESDVRTAFVESWPAHWDEPSAPNLMVDGV